MSGTKFDFIIIGAGGSGAVIASILSYGGKYSVLLIEQGYNHNADPSVINANNIPQADSKPNITDVYPTTRDPGFNFRQVQIKQGRGWGGSTCDGYLYAARPSQTYLQGLETLFGPKFSLQNSNDILRCLENYVPQPGGIIDASRGTAGPLIISQLPQGRTVFNLGSTDIISGINNQTMLSGLAFQLGQPIHTGGTGFIATELIPINDDYNSVFAPETNINIREQAFVKIEGTGFIRSFNGTSYLHGGVVDQISGEGINRRLMIASGTKVLEILFEHTKTINTSKAVGIKALVGDECCKFVANCGVIVCAGAIESPALLMRSGIGPLSVLKNACIYPIIINENVGRHLFMNVGPRWSLTSNNASYGSNPSINGFVNIPTNSISSVYPPPYPPSYVPQRMYQLFVDAVPSIGITGMSGQYDISVPSWNVVPKSEGDISIVSKDIFTKPIININAYSHPDDKILAREFSRRLAYSVDDAISNGAALAWVGPDPSTLSDIALDTLIASNSTAIGGCGTCRMSSNPWNGVVDSNFRVFGTTNLYICDMSIYPYIPDANGTLAAILLGYKLSNQLLFL